VGVECYGRGGDRYYDRTHTHTHTCRFQSNLHTNATHNPLTTPTSTFYVHTATPNPDRYLQALKIADCTDARVITRAVECKRLTKFLAQD